MIPKRSETLDLNLICLVILAGLAYSATSLANLF